MGSKSFFLFRPITNCFPAACAGQFADGAFDAVVDKGGLDALMGEDTPGSEEAGGKLLAEVARLLAPGEGAAYLCVTLAQPHVLREGLLWLLLPLWPTGLQCVQEHAAWCAAPGLLTCCMH